jgi:hypothetical protein
MQDPHDSRTVDVFPETLKRGRGRPKTGTARTNAERQRVYRQRKAAGLVGRVEHPALSVTESVTENREIEMLRARVAELDLANGVLRAQLGEAQEQVQMWQGRCVELSRENTAMCRQMLERPASQSRRKASVAETAPRYGVRKARPGDWEVVDLLTGQVRYSGALRQREAVQLAQELNAS